MTVALRSEQCSATSSQSGQRCRRLANRGAKVCQKHGGSAPQVKAAAAQRIAIAEALANGARRHPWEVLEDALHTADVLMAEARLAVESGKITAALVDKLVNAIERAHRMAKVNLDAGIDQRKLKLAEAQAGQMHQVFTRVLAQLGLTQEQKARVPELLKREIRGVLEIEGATSKDSAGTGAEASAGVQRI
ncbi:MAG TPA: hypothetical protein VF174_15650 [Micromonosporaceae bacterium]